MGIRPGTALPVFRVQAALTCITIASVWTVFLSHDDMASNRSNLTLDEQSFQDLLSAAFTIQAHNDQIKQAQTNSERTGSEPAFAGVVALRRPKKDRSARVAVGTRFVPENACSATGPRCG